MKKLTAKDKKAIAYVCKKTGLTEAEVKALVMKGATSNIIWAAGVCKKHKLGTVRV